MKLTRLTELCLDPSPVILMLEARLKSDLPPSGIIAGAGLAALILSHIWDQNFDDDQYDHYVDWIDEPVMPILPVRYSRPSFSDTEYMGPVQNGFSTLATEQREKIIRHVIQRCQPSFGKDRVLLVLYALDLNAFGVGYDCYSKRLIVTEGFEEFVRTRQLKIQSPVSSESLVNLMKYRELFCCYADIAEEIGLLSLFQSCCQAREEVWAYNDLMNASGKETFDLYRNELENYCQLVELDDSNPVIPGLETVMGVHYRLAIQPEIRNRFQKLAEILDQTRYQPDSYTISAVYDGTMRKSSSKVRARRFTLAQKYPSTACMILTNPDCLNHDFNEKHLIEIEQFYYMHPLCVIMLLEMRLDVVGTARAIRKIEAFARKNGNQIIGLIEMHRRMSYKLDEINSSSLNELMRAYRQLGGEKLIRSPTDLTDFDYSEIVSELTTSTDLECEGWTMRHCIGGYANILKSGNGNVRIFHVDGPHPSTVAVYYNPEEDTYHCDIAGIANCNPTEKHVMIAELLGRYLLRKLWRHTPSNTDEIALPDD